MCLFAGKDAAQKPLLILILKYLARQKNAHSKSVAETLKQDLLKVSSRDCASLLKTCNMSKTLFKCFSGAL